MLRKKQNHIRRFANHSGYETFTGTTDFIKPNTSLCKEENELHYNPIVAVTGVTLDKNTMKINDGETGTLVATVMPEDAANKNITWSSSDESVATVEDGVVTAVGGGDAVITVTTEDGGFTASCNLIVKSNKVMIYTAPNRVGAAACSFVPCYSSNTFSDGVGKMAFSADVTSFIEGFSGRTDLISVDIPESVTSLGRPSFKGCTSLTGITFPSSITTIGTEAFYNCTSLTTVTIPSGVTTLGDYTFMSCTNLTSITFESTTPPVICVNGTNQIFEDTTCTIYVPAESVEAYKTANYWTKWASRIQAIP